MEFLDSETSLDFLDFNANLSSTQDLLGQNENNLNLSRSFEDDLSFNNAVCADMDSLPSTSQQNSPMISEGDSSVSDMTQQGMMVQSPQALQPNVLTVPSYVPQTQQVFQPQPYYYQVMPAPATMYPMAQQVHVPQTAPMYMASPFVFAPQQQPQMQQQFHQVPLPMVPNANLATKRRTSRAAARKHNPLKREQGEVDAPSLDSATSMFVEERQLEKKQKMDEAKKRCTFSPSMQLIKGFLISPENKQCGGKDNKTFLEKHVVAVDMSKLAIPKNAKVKLAVRAQIIGYSKKLQQGNTVLGVLEQQALTMQEGVVEVAFDRLLCKQSSHNCGQKLTVKFAVVDISDKKHPKEIESIETAEFETITKRGVEKQRQKQQRAKKMSETPQPVSTSSPSMATSSVNTSPQQVTFVAPPVAKPLIKCACSPASGPVGTIVSLNFNIAFNSFAPEALRIRFGSQMSFNLQYGVNNTVYTVVPPSPFVGDSRISLSFDHGLTYHDTDASFTFVAPQQQQYPIAITTTPSPQFSSWQDFVVSQ